MAQTKFARAFAAAALCGLALAIPAAYSQGADEAPVKPPEKLADFRDTFENTLTTRSAPAREAFANGLDQLIRERTAASNYEGVIAARDRRKDLAKEVARSMASGGDGSERFGEIAIDVASGNRSGSGLKYDAKAQKVVGLSKKGQSITWEINKTEPGTYNAIVSYACGDPVITDEVTEETEKTGGEFTLREATSLSTTGSEPISRTVASTGGWSQPITRNIGKIKITGNRLTLVLAVTKAEVGGLMHLYAIKLVPDSTSLSATEGPTDSTDEIAALRKQFLSSVEAETSPIIMDYGNSLRSLLDSLSDAAKLDEAKIVQEAFEGARDLRDDPARIYRTQAKPTPASADAEIAALETSYRTALGEIRDDLGEKWLSALSNLKDELTRSQNFAEALLVRGEEQRVTNLLESDPLPPELSVPLEKINLPVSAATLEGATALSPDGDRLTLLETGSSATWKIAKDTVPGTYELLCHFRCGTDNGGDFQVTLGGDQLLEGKIAPAGDGKKNLRAILIGECLVDDSTGTLKLSVTNSSGSAGLMSLRRLELAPPGTWAGMQGNADDSESIGRADPLGNFEKLEGAKWIDNPDRKSGEFAVSHKDKEYNFRLYFVQLPPTEAPASRAGKAELARVAKRLHTTEDKILRFGKKVDRGLRDEVWSESLTIYTRWETRGQQASPYAFILVGDTPISLDLIEKGHARTGGAFPTQAPFIEGKKSTKTFMNRLRDAEKEAKLARRGLWGL